MTILIRNKELKQHIEQNTSGGEFTPQSRSNYQQRVGQALDEAKQLYNSGADVESVDSQVSIPSD